MKYKMIQSFGIAVLGIVMAATSAHALTLSPSDPNPPLIWSGLIAGNCNADCVEGKIGYLGDLTELYKMNVGGPEEKSLAGSYDTIFTGADPNGFEISYTGGDKFHCPDCFLLVKDGTKSPVYIFDLGSWNGEEKIIGENFYLGGGSTSGGISHVSIYSNKDPYTRVPEPSTMLLLGAGLAGLGLWRRKLV